MRHPKQLVFTLAVKVNLNQRMRFWIFAYFNIIQGFPGGAVVKNPPASAEDTGLSPGPGRSHMPRSN